jgi:hypothetical protein
MSIKINDKLRIPVAPKAMEKGVPLRDLLGLEAIVLIAIALHLTNSQDHDLFFGVIEENIVVSLDSLRLELR